MTREEQKIFIRPQDDVLLMESEDYKKGYQNVIMEVKRQFNLGNKKAIINTPNDPNWIHK